MVHKSDLKSDLYQLAIEAALKAGWRIMEIYNQSNFSVEKKSDNSPLTIADKEANDIINDYLVKTKIPVISEESSLTPFKLRKDWDECWIVDPLDGTKEFIKKNGEFTVNIALISMGRPIFGVIYAPALDLLYIGLVKEKKSYKLNNPAIKDSFKRTLEDADEIHSVAKVQEEIAIVGSRTHMNSETAEYIETLKDKYKTVKVIPIGSSLKFCLVAEGSAHVYPRFSPTMEWDTAAGQAICEAVGLSCIFQNSRKIVTYNRENLLNDGFLVFNERQLV